MLETSAGYPVATAVPAAPSALPAAAAPISRHPSSREGAPRIRIAEMPKAPPYSSPASLASGRPDAYRTPARGGVRAYLSLVFLLGIPLLLSTSWTDQGDAAGLESGPAEVQRLKERQSELRQAALALNGQLDRLEAHLQARAALPEAERNRWMVTWQDELQEIKGRFHAWGTVDSLHPDARAEDALRNALLYLYSLQHVASREQSPLDNAEYRRLRDSLRQSLSEASAG